MGGSNSMAGIEHMTDEFEYGMETELLAEQMFVDDAAFDHMIPADEGRRRFANHRKANTLTYHQYIEKACETRIGK
jgi:hypothetical protein